MWKSVVKTGFVAMALLSLAAPMCPAGEPAPVSKQDPAEVTSRVAPAVFKSSANLVQVPVVVRDRQGLAVGNLRAEDFQLSDNGKPQLISRFAIEQIEARESLRTLRNSSDPPGANTGADSLPSRFPGLFVGRRSPRARGVRHRTPRGLASYANTGAFRPRSNLFGLGQRHSRVHGQPRTAPQYPVGHGFVESPANLGREHLTMQTDDLLPGRPDRRGRSRCDEGLRRRRIVESHRRGRTDCQGGCGHG